MRIGVPKEIKTFEYRVGLLPGSVRELVANGHEVLVQQTAGEKVGFDDQAYLQAGARIASSADEIYQQTDMIIKVKEPQPQECNLLRENQILFAYLHLAPDPMQTKRLQDTGCVAIAYETVTGPNNSLPLLAPMSEVAGRMSIQAGANCLEIQNGGNGVLLSGVPGVLPGKVVILGGGVAGSNAVHVAVGIGAQVVVLDQSLERLYSLEKRYGSSITTLHSTANAIEEQISSADVVVGAVLIPGASSPKLITKNMLSVMHPGSVLIDISIDQGGCFETSRVTTHDQPSFVLDGVVHYCVGNMPGAVPRTSTFALNKATLPYALALANLGYKEAMLQHPYLMTGLNICRGKITHLAVAEALQQPYVPPEEMIGA
jgi:alanine dehydrogenase